MLIEILQALVAGLMFLGFVNLAALLVEHLMSESVKQSTEESERIQ